VITAFERIGHLLRLDEKAFTDRDGEPGSPPSEATKS
jgi:hypothetical protein